MQLLSVAAVLQDPAEVPKHAPKQPALEAVAALEPPEASACSGR